MKPNKWFTSMVPFALLLLINVSLFAFAGFFLSPSEANPPISSISVCQAGYDKDGLKIGLVLLPKDKRLENTSFHIMDSDTNETVFTSNLAYSGIYWNLSGWRSEAIYLANFTGLSTEGEFRLETNGRYSHLFKVRTSNWFYWLDEMVAFYRFQRCGEDTRKFIDYCDDAALSPTVPHEPCHTDDAIWNDSGTLRPFDGTGGWHDAGDNNKYGANTPFADSMLYLTYLRLKSASLLNRDQNQVPDILEEARWGSDHLIKQVNFTNGPVFDVIELHRNPYPWNYPTNESGRYGETRDNDYKGNPFKTEQAYKTAGCLALAHRAWKVRDADYAEQCLTAAEKAWNWAQANPNNGGGWYQGSLEHNKIFAAVELYLATGNATYYNFAAQRINQLGSAPNTWWGDMASIALAEFYPNVTAGTLKTKIFNLLKSLADGILNAWKQNPYYIRRETIGNWGSNGPLAHNIGDVLRFYELSGGVTYLRAAERAIGWFFGVNPWNTSFVSGIGTHHTMYVHSRLDNDPSGTSPVIIPGALVDGPLNYPSCGYAPAPWYKDQSRAQDPCEQWRYNEHAIDMPTDLIYAMASQFEAKGVYGPMAKFTYYPSDPFANGTVTFDASASQPGWNRTHFTPIVSYAWDFGDGTPVVTEADPVTTHNYTAAGNYTVTLNVTDSQGLWNTESKTITVYSPFHDVAVVSVMLLGISGCDAAYAKWHPTWPYGFYIEVVVKNKGTFSESSVVVSLYDSSYLIGKSTIASFSAGAQLILNFSWIPLQNLTFPDPMRGYPWPYPTRTDIKANVTVVSGDVNATNNQLVWGTLTIRYPGDAGQAVFAGGKWTYYPADGKVWVEDLLLFGKWGWGSDRSKPGSPKTKYETLGFWCDFNHDGKVYVEDLQVMGKTWGDSPKDGVD